MSCEPKDGWQQIREAEDALKTAIEGRLAAGNVEAVYALKQLLAWVPECGFPEDTPVYCSEPKGAPRHVREKAVRDYIKENELDGLPFCCESYTYELFGKEEARTFLALLSSIARGLGFSMGINDPRLRKEDDESS